MAKFMVAISYREGVVLCEQHDKLDGHYLKTLSKENLATCLKKQTKGTPSFGLRRRFEPKQCFGTLLLASIGS